MIKKRNATLGELNVKKLISKINFWNSHTHSWEVCFFLSGSNLARVLGNLFIAGSETTSTTLLWFMVYMINFPEVQKKVKPKKIYLSDPCFMQLFYNFFFL